MSFIKMLNNKGLRRLPCGTPQRKGDQLEHVLLHITLCLRLCKYYILKDEGLVLVGHTLLTLQAADCVADAVGSLGQINSNYTHFFLFVKGASPIVC